VFLIQKLLSGCEFYSLPWSSSYLSVSRSMLDLLDANYLGFSLSMTTDFSVPATLHVHAVAPIV